MDQATGRYSIWEITLTFDNNTQKNKLGFMSRLGTGGMSTTKTRVPFTPELGELKTKIIGWWDASWHTCQGGDTNLTEWKDRSGSGHHLTVPTTRSGADLKIGSDGINNLPAMSTDRGGRTGGFFLDSATDQDALDPGANDQFFCSIVLRESGAIKNSGASYIMTNGSTAGGGGWTFLWIGSSSGIDINIGVSFYNGSLTQSLIWNSAGYPNPASTNCIFTVHGDGDDVRLRWNGQTLPPTGGTTQDTHDTAEKFSIGCFTALDGSGSATFEGRMSECIYGTGTSTNELNDVEAYLANKYGVTLHSGHQYGSSGSLNGQIPNATLKRPVSSRSRMRTRR